MDSNEMVPIDYDSLVVDRELSWGLNLEETIATMGEVSHWFPKSQCELDEDNKIVEVPRWLAEEKGLI